MALYSPKYNLLFIHIYKTAGTSIKQYIKDIDKSSIEMISVHSNMSDTLAYINRNHIIDNIHSFSIVRNPYEWFFSLYNYIIHQKGSHFMYRFIYNKSFEEFAIFYSQNLKLINSLGSQTENCQSQTEFLFVNNKLAVDTVLKNENLQVEFEQFHNERKLPALPLDKLNFLNSTSKMTNITPKTIDIINYLFEDDFINFGYKMK